MIKKTKKGYEVVSETGKKKLSKDTLSKEQAKKRLAQIEGFKNHPKK